MSENLKRSNPDFSKYDSMSIGELEGILRTDAMGSERADTDVDEILYVMEVLAKKRRQNGIAGKTALEAYQEFQQHYLPMVEEEEEDTDSVPKRKATVIPFRRIAAIAASLVLVFTLTTSANAFGWKDIWNAVARWAEETFSFSTDAEVSDPKMGDSIPYSSFQDALLQYQIPPNLVPIWIPENYHFEEVIVDENPIQESYVAIYRNDDVLLKISIQRFLDIAPEQLEISNHPSEIYSVNGIDYYLFQNNKLNQACWITDIYECYISGELTVQEIKQMIDSIERG